KPRDGIGRLGNAPPKTIIGGAARGLDWLLQARAVQAVFPAVVGAADAAVLHEPVRERRPAVRAVLGHAAVVAGGRAEYHQLFVQDLHGLRRLLGAEFGGVADGLAVPRQAL